MRILVATDAWHPQVNGVVRTLGQVAREARVLGAGVDFLAPDAFFTVPLPSYPEIRLALIAPGDVERRLERIKPDAIHIATEGPIGHAMRRLCIKRGLPFTTSLHTRFPDYLAERAPLAPRLTSDLAWGWLRRFHAPGAATLAATPSLVTELCGRGFQDVKLWPRGVDERLFRPRDVPLDLPRPIFLTVGRVAVEKNLQAFLGLDLPGTKLVVGDGPARAGLARRYPDAVFAGSRQGEALAEIYAAADVFVFPSRTDTFGLVMVEALASGVPVAGYPVPGPLDVVTTPKVGALNDDLRTACLAAIGCDPVACRAHAETFTWEQCARQFRDTLRPIPRSVWQPLKRRVVPNAAG